MISLFPRITAFSTTDVSSRHLTFSCSMVTALLLVSGCGDTAKNEYQPPPPPKVVVSRPLVQTVPIYIEENGETEAVGRADVRARVRGFLEEIHFEPGLHVSQGDPLYVIEKDEYQAAVNSAEAETAASQAAVDVAKSQVGIAQTELERAQIEFDRTDDLVKKNAGSQQELDNAKAARDSADATLKAAQAQVKSAEAAVEKAKANLKRAELDLQYTDVQSPIDGMITKTEVKKGNLVQNDSLLATVVDQSSIYVNFNISDREALRLQQARLDENDGQPQEEGSYKDVDAFLKREIDDSFKFKGKLDYVDQEGVDQETGTLAVRAKFENSNDKILPGLFVRIRVPIGEVSDAILVPERAVQRDQSGSFLLLVDEDSTVERRPITAGMTQDGMVVVEDGITADELFVLDGSQRARPGAKVEFDEPTSPSGTLKLNEAVDETETLPEDKTTETEEEGDSQ